MTTARTIWSNGCKQREENGIRRVGGKNQMDRYREMGVWDLLREMRNKKKNEQGIKTLIVIFSRNGMYASLSFCFGSIRRGVVLNGGSH